MGYGTYGMTTPRGDHHPGRGTGSGCRHLATLPGYPVLDLTAGAFSLLLTAAATVLHGGPTLLGAGGPVAGSVPPWDLSSRDRKESRTFPPPRLMGLRLSSNQHHWTWDYWKVTLRPSLTMVPT